MTNEELNKLAKEARDKACVDISGFKVGAALLTKDGNVIQGCNIEDPSGIGVTNVCAERCAIIKALSEGYRDFEKIAVVGGPSNTTATGDTDTLIFCAPCGACRQYLNSWAPKIKVILQEADSELKEYGIKELLPYSFDETF